MGCHLFPSYPHSNDDYTRESTKPLDFRRTNQAGGELFHSPGSCKTVNNILLISQIFIVHFQI